MRLLRYIAFRQFTIEATHPRAAALLLLAGLLFALLMWRLRGTP